MKCSPTPLEGVLLLEPEIYSDSRGYFFESYHEAAAAEFGIGARFVQDNHSSSVRDVLRGLHFQVNRPQGKLVRAAAGEIFDVAVDLRPDSPTFGRWHGVTLSAENKAILWVPPGMAHGFYVLSESADVLYKVSDYRSTPDERTLLWNDPAIGIDWPLRGTPIMSEKDRHGRSFDEVRKELSPALS